MVRELSKHQSAFLFDCCVYIVRFASLSCYSSAKTRIRPEKIVSQTAQLPHGMSSFANNLLGPDVGTLKGKTTRRSPPIVNSAVPVDITSTLKHYGDVNLCVDLMYVNRVPLLVTLSRNIKFGTVEAVKDRKEATLLKGIATVTTLYRKPDSR